MQIGKKLKNLRLVNNLTQEELADRCELTKGYISQIENDNTSPSIATLVDLLSALKTNLAEFFKDEEQAPQVVFGEDDYFVKTSDNILLKWLTPTAQKNEMEAIELTLSPSAVTERDMPHEGEEFGFVLEGSINVVIGNKKYRCRKGESFYFLSDKPHGLENASTKTTARVVWVSSPPNF